ncbi:hypothetical protein HU200_014194 [Digitaria exilis]|uniref:Uncharacterized protein n=1 Tax=Digitaria exilis TaxID=1010633 RepID=A0A835KLR4_9POAL|nr:hypothetical protein HU200_014194 [Digitaria exilis]
MIREGASYPLRRIAASSLFYPSANQAKSSTTHHTPMPLDEPPLPRPCISFMPSRSSWGKGALDFFGFFGVGKNKTLLAAVDYRGVSYTYDVDGRVVGDIATPQEAKSHRPVSVPLGDALYVLDRNLIPGRRGCFDALTFGRAKDLMCTRLHWDWRSLQPPPFMSEPGYKATGVSGYAVVGGSGILVSTGDVGTHCFDTVRGSWDKVGDWELPFYGRANFLPEYGAWVGFSAQDNRICYLTELGASMQRQPELDMVWDDPTMQVYTNILKSQLVHLGSGKLCVARLFERVENEYTEHGNIPQVEGFHCVNWTCSEAQRVWQGNRDDTEQVSTLQV